MKLLFVLRQTFNNLWRERTPVIATILTIFIALSILIALFEVSWILYNQLHDLKKNMVVEIYLKSSISESETARIRSRLEDHKTIDRIRYISKDAAAGIFQEEFGEDINEILDKNPLPPSFEIRLRPEFNHPDYMSILKRQFEGMPEVEEVHYRHSIIEKLENVTEAVVVAGIFILIILVFAMNLLIRNTIKLSVYARKRQIMVMKILGSGSLLIRMPFILEGAVEGLIGGILSASGLIITHRFIAGTFTLVNFSPRVYQLLWINTISLGIVLGLLASAYSAGRFINKIYSKK
ncbi:MAG: ABC transporter permease [Fidelibacterota bacterium]